MSREAQEPRSGHTIAGRYDLHSIIGRGGHGLVWKARDRQTGRQVAVKMLTDVAAKDPQHVERLRREQLALVKLAGTAAVELIDLCQTSAGKLCLVMELLEGVDLEAHLEMLEQRGQRISVTTLLSVLEPVVATLERAHEQGIIHRDLKPANVFLLAERAGGGVRVLDFGLARLRSQLPLTAAGTIVGSPSYIAPEAWKGRSDGLDQRVDVYSFGVLVFRALTAQFPFPGKSLQDKFKGATSAERPGIRHLVPDVPEEMDDWVKQVLAIDPDLRFRTLRGAWNGLLAALGNPALAQALVTAEDLASAAAAAPPLDAPIPAASPEPGPGPTLPPAVRAADSSADSASIELPMTGPLPAIKAVFKRAATVVARVADAVTGAERKRTPVPSEPSPVRGEAPEPPADKPAPVSVAPVVAVGGRAREGGSMVRQWLAGSDLDVKARSKGEPSDVVSWLSRDESGAPREPTLLHGVRAPAKQEEKELEPRRKSVEHAPAPAETGTLARARRKTTKKKAAKKVGSRKKMAKKAAAKKAGSTRTAAKKTTSKQSVAKKSVAKKASPKKAAAKKARPKNAPAKKSG